MSLKNKSLIEADIDIDTNDRLSLLMDVPHIKAINRKGAPHVSGIYLQRVPMVVESNTATIHSEDAHLKGYFKLDFLNLSLYSNFDDQGEMNRILDMETDWSMLHYRSVVEQLFHVAKHFDRMRTFGISCVEDMAMFLAMIRPAKAHLFGKSKDFIRKTVWDRPDDPDEYYFKKSHAYSYAIVVKLNLNLIKYKLDNKTVLYLLERDK